jgi:hypothetical protein
MPFYNGKWHSKLDLLHGLNPTFVQPGAMDEQLVLGPRLVRNQVKNRSPERRRAPRQCSGASALGHVIKRKRKVGAKKQSKSVRPGNHDLEGARIQVARSHNTVDSIGCCPGR